ncbi:MAG: hypothetical protein ABI728_08625, partial [Betaproteobacteria bacterium]
MSGTAHSKSVRREARETDSDFTPHPSRLTPHDSTQPAIRLGLRMVSGLSEAAAKRLLSTRDELLESLRASRLTPHPSPAFEELALRAKLSRKDMNALAAAGALGSLAGHRRHAAWLVAGIERCPPLLASAPIVESVPVLAAPTEGQDILADYASLGLTLGRHPLALLRPRLKKLSMITAEELRHTPTGTPIRVAGLVTCRQHPGT